MFMRLDIKRAFTLPFASKDWWIKLGIAGVLVALGMLLYDVSQHSKFTLLAFIVSIPISALPFGFMLKAINNEITNQETYLPEWNQDLKSYFKYGIASILPTLGYLIVFFIIALLIGASLFAVLFFSGFLKSLTILSIGIITCPLLLLPIGMIIGQTVYALELKVPDGIKFWQILITLLEYPKETAVGVLLTIALYAFYLAVSFFLDKTTNVYFASIIQSLLSVPINLISLNLFAQIFKQDEPI